MLFFFFFTFLCSALVANKLHICKSGGTCPVLNGVGATFMGQFHTNKHYKTAILNAQCHKDYFPSVCVALKVMHEVILLTCF